MKIRQEYAEVKTNAIKPHPQNPNRGDVEFIQESIQANGWYGVIVVQKSTMCILAGEHRWRAAKKEHALRVPVVLLDVDDREAMRIMLVDNESARKAHVDEEKVALVLDSLIELGDEDLIGTGFTLDDLKKLHDENDDGEDDEDDGPPEPLDPPDKDDLETQFGVIVMVKDERDQEKVFNQMQKAGYQVRCVAV